MMTEMEPVSPAPDSFSQLKINKWTLLIVVIIFSLMSYLAFYLHSKYPTTSVTVSAQYILANLGHQHAQMSKQVIGFLPYWRLDDVKYFHFDLLSEVIFFSLSADENGEVVKVRNGETDPGWRWWNSTTIQDLIAKTQISGGKFALSMAMQKNQTLNNFLDNKSAQQTLINNLQEIVKTKHLDGLNLDFEYAGEPDPGYQEKFTQFVQNLSSSFHNQLPNTQISIDFFPLSVEKPRLFKVGQIAQIVDKVVVMSYDYYSASSDTAGPVAPMAGYKEGKYFFDVTTAYSDYLKIVPKDKLIMGVPYYGWDFPVEDGQKPLSPVLPANDQNGYPAVISYGRMRGDKDIKSENCQWDELAQASWCFYKDLQTHVDHQVWLEDNRSIEAKFNFAKDQALAGIAIWTLGYDKDYPDLWQMITAKFTRNE